MKIYSLALPLVVALAILIFAIGSLKPIQSHYNESLKARHDQAALQELVEIEAFSYAKTVIATPSLVAPAPMTASQPIYTKDKLEIYAVKTTDNKIILMARVADGIREARSYLTLEPKDSTYIITDMEY